MPTAVHEATSASLRTIRTDVAPGARVVVVTTTQDASVRAVAAESKFRALLIMNYTSWWLKSLR